MSDPEIPISSISELWNCEHAFEYRCPKSWASLDLTETNGIRHCDVCNENVTFCTTPDEFVRLGNAGKCVAIPGSHLPAGLMLARMGRASPQKYREFQEFKRRIRAWWVETLNCEPSFAHEAMAAIESLLNHFSHWPPELSQEYRNYLTGLAEAVRTGPEALYLHLRIRPSGKRDNQQNIFRGLRLHFPMTFREFKQLATRLDRQHPI